MEKKLCNILIASLAMIFVHCVHAMQVEEVPSDEDVSTLPVVHPGRVGVDGEVIESTEEPHTGPNRRSAGGGGMPIPGIRIIPDSTLNPVLQFAQKKTDAFCFEGLNDFLKGRTTIFLGLCLVPFCSMGLLRRAGVQNSWALVLLGGVGGLLATRVPFAVQKWYINRKFAKEERTTVRNLQRDESFQREVLHSHTNPAGGWLGGKILEGRPGRARYNDISDRVKFYFHDIVSKAKREPERLSAWGRFARALDWSY